MFIKFLHFALNNSN